jgi:hypothetical protein
LAAVVVRAGNESAVGRWQKDILKGFGYTQRTDIHYRKLSPRRKQTSCEYIADQPLLLFVVMSNKKICGGIQINDAQKSHIIFIGGAPEFF